MVSDATAQQLMEIALRDVPSQLVRRMDARIEIVENVAAATAEQASWLVGFDRDTRYILRIADGATAIDEIDPAAFLADISSAIQDFVIDQLGAPWPVSASGRVLSPGVQASAATWSDGTERVCRIGELHTAVTTPPR
ncbi:hypothetical protein [Microbacterium dauci]|uniref:Uncharacterized protein n=1 Tax=Microbacterium dauci TaxID=3048008 RepID=A0ABT6ZAW4_9MICO|nr:hypothetical protein [Microbacterium sp. LX3-4]MDJ1113306.1 hypothetical protein [Microbacterium sp. LX3-4]